MPVKQTYKVSELEKRLTMLNLQLYGKKVQEGNSISKTTNHESKTTDNATDIASLKQDLSKIALLASLAIGAELILYFSKLLDKIKFF